MSLLKWMGVGQAAEPAPAAVAIPGEKEPGDASSKMFGMENFGNTCYANSILQALYFCQPFRDLVCITPDGDPLPEVSLTSLVARVEAASTTPTPGPPATPAIATPKPTAPRITFKRQNSVISTPTTGSNVDSSAPTPVGNGTPHSELAATPAPPPVSLPPTLFSALRSLFLHISLNVEEKGLVTPSAFISKLKKENIDFRTSQHQDAHEFLNYLLNKIAEEIDENTTRYEKEMAKQPAQPPPAGTLESASSRDSSRDTVDDGPTSRRSGAPPGSFPRAADAVASHSSTDSSISSTASVTPASSTPTTPPPALKPLPSDRPTLVQNLFQGQLTNETRCLSCQTVSHRDEAFLDLSIDIEPNSSVTACLREFSKGEMLKEDNRFKCDACNNYCDAEKKMKVKVLPNVLALHLKRFKYIEDQNRVIRPTKLTYRVAFPLELRLFDTSDDADNPDRLYELFAIVVHIGAGLHHGHYVTVVRTQGKWVVFDDDTVETIKESDISKYFGDAPGGQGYVLFYQAVDLDFHSLGLPDAQHHVAPRTTIPPCSFPPSLSSEKQFIADGQIYTPYAGTSQAAQAAASASATSPVQSPQPSRKGLRLDIPVSAKFDANVTLNQLLSGPMTMPSLRPVTPGTAAKEQVNGGFFSRTLRHSQSKLDKGMPVGLASPVSPTPVAGSASAGAVPTLKTRPSSRGKDAANWFAAKMGKDKKKEGEEGSGVGTLMPGPENPPPVPPLPVVLPGQESPLVGLGISDVRRPSLPTTVEQSPSSFSPVSPVSDDLAPPSLGLASPVPPSTGASTVPLDQRLGFVSSPASPVATSVSPQRPAVSSTPHNTLQTPDHHSSPRSRSAENKERPAVQHRPRPSTSQTMPRPSTASAVLSSRPSEETNGHEKARGRRMSRDQDKERLGENTHSGGTKWYQLNKKDKRRTSTPAQKSDEEGEVLGDGIAEVVDGTPTPSDAQTRPPPSMHHSLVPPLPPLESIPSEVEGQLEPSDSVIYDESESTTSSDDRQGTTTSSAPLLSSGTPLPLSSFSLSPRTLPASPVRTPFDPPPAHGKPETKPKRRMSMTKNLRLSWFGKEERPAREDVAAPGTVGTPPTPAEKKGRMPSLRQ